MAHRVKLTWHALKHMAKPPSFVLGDILSNAGLIQEYIDHNDGRMVYKCKNMPMDFRAAFISWEKYKGDSK